MVAVRLFVGNVPYSASEQTLRDLFGQAGSVTSVFVPTDRLTGRPRGFAFVEMRGEAEAREAVRRFDGYALDARRLRVSPAEEREARRPSFPRYGEPVGGRGRPGERRRRPERSPGR